ncbi:hypothetical protein ACTJJE_04425 [Mycolicibacterium sp. 22603]|uniref:hypothetical protein n=1 Tax=Mycolicibacterium sp. 22603 TaxID=3453950 RepID=UPI003F83D875
MLMHNRLPLIGGLHPLSFEDAVAELVIGYGIQRRANQLGPSTKYSPPPAMTS